MRLVTQEELVSVGSHFRSIGDPTEPIHIELPLETCDFGLFEESWEDELHELLRASDNEGLA